MIFEIKRTSQWFSGEDKPPHDKAFIKEFERYVGANKIQDKGWFIELNTLEDLLNLQEEMGEKIIISDYLFRYNNIGVEHSVEIYDDYRE